MLTLFFDLIFYITTFYLIKMKDANIIKKIKPPDLHIINITE